MSALHEIACRVVARFHAAWEGYNASVAHAGTRPVPERMRWIEIGVACLAEARRMSRISARLRRNAS